MVTPCVLFPPGTELDTRYRVTEVVVDCSELLVKAYTIRAPSTKKRVWFTTTEYPHMVTQKCISHHLRRVCVVHLPLVELDLYTSVYHYLPLTLDFFPHLPVGCFNKASVVCDPLSLKLFLECKLVGLEDLALFHTLSVVGGNYGLQFLECLGDPRLLVGAGLGFSPGLEVWELFPCQY